MNLLETLEYFIDDQRGRLQDIEWEIREESNYELNSIESLSEEYDFNQELHDNLLKIKSIIEAQQ